MLCLIQSFVTAVTFHCIIIIMISVVSFVNFSVFIVFIPWIFIFICFMTTINNQQKRRQWRELPAPTKTVLNMWNLPKTWPYHPVEGEVSNLCDKGCTMVQLSSWTFLLFANKIHNSHRLPFMSSVIVISLCPPFVVCMIKLFPEPVLALMLILDFSVWIALYWHVSQVTQKSSVASRFCALQTSAKALMSRPDHSCCAWHFSIPLRQLRFMCKSYVLRKKRPTRKLRKVKNGTGILGSILAKLWCDTFVAAKFATDPNYLQLLFHEWGTAEECCEPAHLGSYWKQPWKP